MLDLIIVGGGPAGLYSATLSSLHGLNAILIEGLSSLGGQLSALYPEKDIVDLPGFSKITAQGYINELINQNNAQKNPTPLKVDETVLSFKKIENGYEITTNKDTYQTKTILFASGMGVFSPRKIGLENEDLFTNISYSINDSSRFNNKNVIILGGGDSAVDYANMLSSKAKKVTIIHRREDFRAQTSSVKKLEENKVNILKPYSVKSLSKEDATIITIVNQDNELKLPFEELIVSYGLISKTCEFPLEIKNNGFIVNRFHMTSQENVFAIGNACYYEGKVKNITAALGEAVIAITKIDQIIHPNKNIPVHF